jgi:hypothetical protein
LSEELRLARIYALMPRSDAFIFFALVRRLTVDFLLGVHPGKVVPKEGTVPKQM